MILEPQKVDWNRLSFFGAPLTSEENSRTYHEERNASSLALLLKSAAVELEGEDPSSFDERKLEVVQAMILAIRDHYPSVFRDYFRNSPAIVQLIPKKISGRVIKLRRLALSRMAEYL